MILGHAAVRIVRCRRTGLINTPTFGIRRGVGGSHGGGEAEGAKHVSTSGRCEWCCEGYAEQHWELIRDRLSGQKVLRKVLV